ncbi:MAG: hypothetical protein FGF48_07580 [Candidatus Brockarchaeota archaeon]|nr:hypothetical protein [Candidatus Brockarchaeota archaeon]
MESELVEIQEHQIDQVLNEIGSDEAQVSVTKAEFIDYRFFFPTDFLINGKKITLNLFKNEMKIDGVTYKFSADPNVFEGKIHVNAKFGGNNINGKNLVLSFYQDSELRIRHDVSSRLIKEIKIDTERDLMMIKYLGSDGERDAEYSFNFRSLNEQMDRIPCEMAVEDEERIRLKEELFRSLGYNALEELKNRIEDPNEEERVVLLVHFDTNKKAYCRSKEFRVSVPSGAGKITGIEIVAFKELNDLKKWAIKVLGDPQNTDLKGKLGEVIAEKRFMDIILAEIAERSGIPRDKLVVKYTGDGETPDFKIEVIGTDERIAVIEVKYIGDPENVKEFGDQLNGARTQIKKRFNDPDWAAPYGVIVVIAWPPEKIVEDEPYPEMVGSYRTRI